VVRPVFVEVQATHVSKRFHPPIDDQRHQGVFFVSDPGSDAKRIDCKDADEFDDLVMVAAVARQPIVFELSAAYSTERRLDELICLIVRKIIRRLREDWLIFREQILSGEACLIDVVRSHASSAASSRTFFDNPAQCYARKSNDGFSGKANESTGSKCREAAALMS